MIYQGKYKKIKFKMQHKIARSANNANITNFV